MPDVAMVGVLAMDAARFDDLRVGQVIEVPWRGEDRCGRVIMAEGRCGLPAHHEPTTVHADVSLSGLVLTVVDLVELDDYDETWVCEDCSGDDG